MDKIETKKIELSDIGQLQIIGRNTFRETFASENTEENIKKYLEASFSSEKLTHELKNKNSEFYFAMLDKQAIGYLKINFGPDQTELKDQAGLEIERIYVLKKFHGKQVGQILYRLAFDLAKKSNADYLWLGVWEKNTRAINFYKKNGFVEFDKHLFKLGDDAQIDIMMKFQIDKQQ